MVYSCEACRYETDNKSHMQRHIKTKRHEDKSKLVQKTTIENGFECEYCNFSTSKKANYTRHCKTKKHIFNLKASLDCKFSFLNDKKDEKVSLVNAKEENDIAAICNAVGTMAEQNRTLIEMLKTQVASNTVNSHNTTHTNSHNVSNTINLVNFYNEHRSDALTMKEFNEMLRPITQVELFEFDGKNYSRAIANILGNRLNKMPKQKVPLVHYHDNAGLGFLVHLDGEGWKIDQANSEVINSVDSAHKGVYECASSLLANETFMEKYSDRIMEILSKIKIDKSEIEKSAVDEVAKIKNVKAEDL